MLNPDKLTAEVAAARKIFGGAEVAAKNKALVGRRCARCVLAGFSCFYLRPLRFLHLMRLLPLQCRTFVLLISSSTPLCFANCLFLCDRCVASSSATTAVPASNAVTTSNAVSASNAVPASTTVYASSLSINHPKFSPPVFCFVFSAVVSHLRPCIPKPLITQPVRQNAPLLHQVIHHRLRTIG